ncbi:hypothetical protein FB451DRAFT_775679 [Mycena latifolia]|nr:hypothetical protein FB451DRAFT_775679 [Mycena latifolia]
MTDEEKGPLETARADQSHEAATAKLWAVYVSEAEKYDKGLVESWKSDMEGMLIFAGLFSASLTAFLIESYKTLSPDPGDRTAILLAQISLQLSTAANGSTCIPPRQDTFTPPATSLICNALWFTSLALSLTCALIATLLEQWARNFLHRTEMRSAPVIRARIFSYLFYGLKRFNMHAVVEIIPLLLHASLFLFFAGLVAFLIPVNTVITAVAATLLAIVTGIYSLLTIFPLLYLDCPYRTPLSGAFWRLQRDFMASLRRWDANGPGKPKEELPENQETMVESVFCRAINYSEERLARDKQALCWTVKSLADDVELEPFVEAIPDVLWGLKKRRYVYDDYIRNLIDHPDVRLLGRMQSFYDSCASGLLPSDTLKRRNTFAYKALWTIGSLSAPGGSSEQALPQLYTKWSLRDESDPEIAHYRTSAFAMCQWAAFCAGQYVVFTDEPPSFHAPYDIMMEYLLDSAWLTSPPFRFEDTQKIISPHPVALSALKIHRLEDRLEMVVYDRLKLNTTLDKTRECDWVDEIFAKLLSFLDPQMEDKPPPLPQALIDYLNKRQEEDAVGSAAQALPQSAWKGIPQTILDRPSLSTRYHDDKVTDDDNVLDDTLSVVWILHREGRDIYDVPILEAILETVSRATSRSIVPSLIAMSKSCILWAMFSRDGARTRTVEEQNLNLRHPILPRETAVLNHLDALSLMDEKDLNVVQECTHTRWTEGTFQYLSDFMEICSSKELPFKAAETIQHMTRFIPNSKIHPTLQIKFTIATEKLFNAKKHGTDEETQLLKDLLDLDVFDVYSRPRDSWSEEQIPWLDNPQARSTLKAAVAAYLDQLDGRLLRRAQEMVVQLDALHQEQDEEMTTS